MRGQTVGDPQDRRQLCDDSMPRLCAYGWDLEFIKTQTLVSITKIPLPPTGWLLMVAIILQLLLLQPPPRPLQTTAHRTVISELKTKHAVRSLRPQHCDGERQWRWGRGGRNKYFGARAGTEQLTATSVQFSCCCCSSSGARRGTGAHRKLFWLKDV